MAKPRDRPPGAEASPQDENLSPKLEWDATSFREVSLLGRGGMGSVFGALDTRTGRRVALKLLNRLDERRRARFLREGHLAARVSHPNVVKVHEFLSLGQVGVLVSELVPEAQTLEAAWEDLTLRRRVEQLRDAAQGVAAAHALGIVHRDLKPENILVDAEGRVRVTDFGVAYGSDLDRLTQSGATLGSPAFMAPEQFGASLSARPTPSSDVWALGGILYLALTDEVAFYGSSLLEVAAMLGLGFRPGHRRALAGAPPALIKLVEDSLQVNPSERPADAEAFASRLQAWLDDPSASGPRRSFPWLKTAGLFLLAAALSTAGGALVTEGTPHQPQPSRAKATPEHRALQLREGLAALHSGTPAQGLRVLARLKPPPSALELQRSRAGLVAAILSSASTPNSRRLRADLARLEGLAELLHPAERGRLEGEAVAAIVEEILRREALDERGLASLEPLRRAGARIEDPALGLRIATRFFEHAMFRRLTPGAQRKWFLLLIALDVPTPSLEPGEFRYSLGPLGTPKGPGSWASFVRLQAQAPTPAVQAQLRKLLFAPPPDLRLGPHRWSESVVQLSLGASPEAALALLDQALAKDPECVPALVGQAKHYAALGKRAQVLRAASRCLTTMRAHGYLESPVLSRYYGLELHGCARALATVGAMAEAKALIRQGAEHPSDRRKFLLRDFPHLKD